MRKRPYRQTLDAQQQARACAALTTLCTSLGLAHVLANQHPVPHTRRNLE